MVVIFYSLYDRMIIQLMIYSYIHTALGTSGSSDLVLVILDPVVISVASTLIFRSTAIYQLTPRNRVGKLTLSPTSGTSIPAHFDPLIYTFHMKDMSTIQYSTIFILLEIG
jgi:hypothetical protein